MGAAEVVVTGAGGVLGRLTVRALQARGVAVLGLGRGVAPPGFEAPWVRADLNDGAALRAALPAGAIVVHAASDPLTRGADVRTAVALAQAAHAAGVARIVYVQIAGVGAAARSRSAYYREKTAAEQVLRRGAVPCSCMAATQFHELIDRVFSTCRLGPVLLRPPFNLQPVDAAFAAERLADHVCTGEAVDATVCGPELLSSCEMAATWSVAQGQGAMALPIPAIGVLAGFACIERVAGTAGGRSWERWLRETSARSRPRDLAT